jgi:hypothetical protein
MQQHHVGVLGVDPVERRPDALVIVAVLQSVPPVKAIRVPSGTSNVSARRRAAMNSRLSIIVAVNVRWLSIEPVRGR